MSLIGPPKDIYGKLISFEVDGVVFHGAKMGVITKLKEKFAPYLVGIYCLAHTPIMQ